MFPLKDINPTRITPFVTVGFIVANLLVFFVIQSQQTVAEREEFLYRRAAIGCEITTLQPLSAEEILTGRCLSGSEEPVFPEKIPLFSVLTSMFLHGGIAHVVFNMWFLWIFGNNVEEAFGRLRYILMYIAGGVGATLTFVAVNPDSTIPLVGASGAIAAVLGSYAVLFPGHRVLSLLGWFIVPVPAAVFLGVWFVLQFGLGGTNVAWEAHAGGFAFGFALTLLFRRRLLRRVSLSR
ncbi:MAG: rhomboid family intramembrane serine protease [Acidobacteria bacterium]|nr:rhomboid family intramembrane serine protease [Acidobacteriota bacterium]TDI50500.1 MAG: rhomboid family intramembrane serine protease [Acidobacteriota bacterium]TDI55271.1 MAG: rhomboid family intramembrane serine protease [Acidobacteriota bacterium]